jgi:hypothetical protein
MVVARGWGGRNELLCGYRVLGFWLFCVCVCVGLGFELGLHSQSCRCITRATPPVHFGYFGDGVLQTMLRLTSNHGPSDFIFQVARTTGINHLCLAGTGV